MQVIIVALALVGVASAGVIAPAVTYAAAPAVVAAPTVISRVPSLDSAVIKSDRIGGNFAYSVAEGHAYAAQTPIISHITSPVGVTYTAGAPVVTGIHAPTVLAAHGILG